MIPRSLFFLYKQRGNVISDAKGKVTVGLSGWKDGIRRGDLREVTCPKKGLGTAPIRFYATLFVGALGSPLSLARIDEDDFVKFLVKEGAEDDSWTMRFWEIDEKKGWSRTLTAGKEGPKVWSQVIESLNAVGRSYNWAGVEFTHPKLHTRVMMHRWPVASIAPYGAGGSGYTEIKERFMKLL
jgi:hypothetical protein